MRFVITTQQLHEMRLLQELIEKVDNDAAVFLEWDAARAVDILLRQNIDVLICEVLTGEPAYMELLSKADSINNRPEIIALIDPSQPSLPGKLESLPAMSFLAFPLEPTRAKNVLLRTMEYVRAKQRTVEIERCRRYWESNKHMVQQHFWTRLCSGQTSLVPSDFMKEAENCGIEMKLNDTYQAAVLSRKLIRERNTDIEWKTRKILLARAEGWFRNAGADFVILNQLRPLLIIRNMPVDEFLYQCDSLIHELQQENNLPVCIYYDADVYCENIFSSVLSIMATEKEAMEEKPGVYPAVRSMLRRRDESDLPSLAYMEELLRSGSQTQIIRNVRASFQEQLRKGEVTGSYLKAMRLDITQMIFSVLKEQSVPAHKVMMHEGLKELEINAHISVDNFLAWLEAVLACLPENDAEVSVSEAVRSYVRSHIREELSRETIAAALYMNVDYLGRLYKRETGRSLGSFVRDEKMNEACHLLTSTQMSVGEIGAELGFENFSHFSKLFKQVIGCTPREYRNLCRIENPPAEMEKTQMTGIIIA